MSKRRVVITGLGVVTSLGETVDESWEALAQGCAAGAHDLAALWADGDARWKVW